MEMRERRRVLRRVSAVPLNESRVFLARDSRFGRAAAGSLGRELRSYRTLRVVRGVQSRPCRIVSHYS